MRSCRALVAVALIWAFFVAACASSSPETARGRHHHGRIFKGRASFYGRRFQGHKTASGERYDRHALTAAHRKLPFGTVVRVTNRRNGRSVKVRINDRGPFGGGRILDLSEAAARRLKMLRAGVVPVTVEVLSVPGR